MLIRIILAAVMLAVLHFVPAAGWLRFGLQAETRKKTAETFHEVTPKS